MPNDDKPGWFQCDDSGRFVRSSIWLSLSGGGLRAAIFQYGCLKRLHELGLLAHVYAISATSGGAIIAALLSRHKNSERLEAERGVFLNECDWDEFEKEFLELARRGVFAPVAKLTSAYLCYVFGGVFFLLGLWPRLRPSVILAGVAILAIGGLLHFALALLLLNEKAHAPSETAQDWAYLDTRYSIAPWARKSWKRLLRMLLFPSELRWQLLNLRAFKGELLMCLNNNPRVYLTAVDLNTGNETVFTTGLFSDLSDTGCRYLWEQRAEEPRYESREIDIAQAVSASSAIPPFFRPMAVGNSKVLAGVFVDGGVLDNFALNVPKAFSVRIHRRRGQRYDEGRDAIPNFRQIISFLLAVDGGKAPEPKRQRKWSRLFATFRLMSVLVDQQFEAAFLATRDLDWNAGFGTAVVGIQVGFPEKSPLRDDEIERYIRRVRTHLDAFSAIECGVLAYCGYTWINELVLQKHHLVDRYEGVKYIPAKAMADLMPPSIGNWHSSLAEIRNHLRYSNRRFGLFRFIGRKFGV